MHVAQWQIMFHFGEWVGRILDAVCFCLFCFGVCVCVFGYVCMCMGFMCWCGSPDVKEREIEKRVHWVFLAKVCQKQFGCKQWERNISREKGKRACLIGFQEAS